jgi:WD40 repeat protein
LGEVASIAGVSEQVVAEVVEHFRQPGCNFLVATPQTPLTGKTTLDISHEALLRQWERLGKWLDDEAKSAADYCRLEADARSWQKKEKGFLQSPELDISLQEKQKWTSEWARRYGTDFDLAMRYLKESEAEKERRDAEAEAQRNELAGERARAAQATQTATGSRRAFRVLTGMAVVILAMFIFALFQRNEAQKQSEMATAASIEAKKQSEIATAASIAARAYQLRDERLDTALLLATEAHRLATEAQPDKIPPDTFGTLVTAAYYNPRVVTYLHGVTRRRGIASIGDSPINAVAFSRDGKLVATGAYNGKVELWDVDARDVDAQKHRVVENLGLANDAVRAIAFSTDGRYMAVSSNSVWLRDLVKGQNRLLPPDAGATPPVYSLAFSSDSKLLAYGDKKGNIVIRDLMADSAVTLRAVPESPVRGLSFDKDAKVLAAGCSDGRILIWNRQVDEWVEETDRKLVPEPADKNGAISKTTGVQCLMVSSEGRYLAVGRNSGAVNLYDLSGHSSSLKPIASAAHGGFVTSLAFAPPESGPEPKLRLITSSTNGSLQLWEVPSLKPIGDPMTGHVGRVFGVAFSRDSRFVASGGEDGCAILWDTKENVAQTVPEEEPEREFSVAFSPDGIWEAYGYKRKETEDIAKVQLKKHDNESGEKDWPVGSSGEAGVPLVTFSGDGHCLATTMPGGPLRVYDLTKIGKGAIPPLVKEIPIRPSPKIITSIGLSQDGSRIAAGYTREGKRQATIWKVATGVKFDDLPEDKLPPAARMNDDILVVQFSPDGTLLVIGWGENAVIWRVGESETKVLAKHTGKIRGVAFSPDGKTFVTASGDTTLILWDKSGDQKSPPLTGHKREVETVAFSRDGKWLASGSRDRLVILWDVETGLLMGRLFGHTDTARALAFEGDPTAPPKTLYSGSFQGQLNAGDGGLIKWDLDPAKLEEICRDRANRNASTTEWKAYIRTGEYHKTWPDLPEEPIPK